MAVLGVILIVFSMNGQTDAVALTHRFRSMAECQKQTAKTAKMLSESGRELEVISALCYGPKDIEV
jgi:ABC-type ATPase with predicted acetyltransferase domain